MSFRHRQMLVVCFQALNMSHVDLTCVPLALLDANSGSLFSARLISAWTEVIASVTGPPCSVHSLLLTSGDVRNLTRACDPSTGQSPRLHKSEWPWQVCQQRQVRALTVNCGQWSVGVWNSSVLRVSSKGDVQWRSELFFLYIFTFKTHWNPRPGHTGMEREISRLE